MRRKDGVDDDSQRNRHEEDRGGREKLRAVMDAETAAGAAQFIPTQKDVTFQLALKALRAVTRRLLARQAAVQFAMQHQVLEQRAMRRVALEIGLDLHALGRRQLAIDVGGQFRFDFFYVLGHFSYPDFPGPKAAPTSSLLARAGVLAHATPIQALSHWGGMGKRTRLPVSINIFNTPGKVRRVFPTDMALAHRAGPTWRGTAGS